MCSARVLCGPACTPDILGLPALGAGPATDSAVRAFGSGGLLAGDGAGLPVYWTADHAVHAVAMPEGFVFGEVRAVNAKGLMVGTVRRANDYGTAVGFTYQQGAAAVRLVSGGTTASAVTDVNDSGRFVGMEAGVAKEWLNGAVVRELPVPADAHPSTKIVSVDGINARGDIVGTALTSYVEEDERAQEHELPRRVARGGRLPAVQPPRVDPGRPDGPHVRGRHRRARPGRRL
ncbi:hypothetical protein AB0B01_03510 [Streptomyces sp. NPDC044571]|uniref:hypothetical protein n=1 Tax=Streptomyces sp. NPDC044571 TaxID=3155371 RepID=UPI0033D9BB16